MGTDASQWVFARALTDPDAALPPGVIGSAARFNIHRNNIIASLTAVLASRFPVIRRLVGDDFFRAATGTFIARHPPQSPALVEFGGAFAVFLAAFEPAASLPYLTDMAGWNGLAMLPITPPMPRPPISRRLRDLIAIGCRCCASPCIRALRSSLHPFPSCRSGARTASTPRSGRSPSMPAARQS
jgi:Putative DNA-binding domain